MATQRGRPPKTKPALDFDNLLTPEDRERIRKAAVGEVAKEAQEAAEKAFLEKALEDERKKVGLDEESEEVFPVMIDLPGFTNSIKIDGREYFHGQTYKFPLDQLDTVNEIMARAWDHENEIGGANRDVYRKPRETVLRQPN